MPDAPEKNLQKTEAGVLGGSRAHKVESQNPTCGQSESTDLCQTSQEHSIGQCFSNSKKLCSENCTLTYHGQIVNASSTLPAHCLHNTRNYLHIIWIFLYICTFLLYFLLICLFLLSYLFFYKHEFVMYVIWCCY